MSDFLASARARLAKLESRHRAGKLDAASYDTQRRAIERELSQHLLEAAPAGPAEAAARPSRSMIAVLLGGVLAVAVGGYLATGSPSLLGRPAAAVAAVEGHPGVDPSASGAGSADSQAQLAAMVEKLAARMKDRPDDFEGWTMLARSYAVIGRFADALPAYARASELQPKNANLLADYADAVAATRGTANNPQTIALVERALALEPEHPKALALAGTADFDRGDYARAIVRWQKIVDGLPPGTEIAKQIEGSIVDARERLAATGLSAPASAPAARTAPATGTAPAVAAVPAPARPAAMAAAPPAAASAAAPAAPAAAIASVSGTVTLDPSLAAKAAPGDTVFVYARAAGGSRMPLALQRARVSDLPLRFKLDDSMAMAAGANLSSAGKVIVAARVSKSGSAMAQPGDLTGESAPMAPNGSGIAIRIDKTVGSGP
jgi:cytochrome c-type biogenesis protein CcmH